MTRIVGASTLIGLGVIGAWLLLRNPGSPVQLFGPPGPEAVMKRTVAALEAHDATTLCKLADEDELRRLNLNPSNVNAFLLETLWAQRGLKAESIERLQEDPVDIEAWVVRWSKASGVHHAPVSILAYDTSKNGWRLALSSLLMYASGMGKKSLITFIDRCKRHKISGLFSMKRTYYTIDDLQQIVEQRAKRGR